MISFDGQCVIVTGAGNGLGRAYALLLGRLGAKVVVNDLGSSVSGDGASHRSADHVVAEIRSVGGAAVANYDSVATDEGCRNLAAAALGAYGRIDAVVHNAGILRNAPFEVMTNELFFPVLETHLFGAFFLSRAVWPTMVEQGFGRFVFTSSASGLFGRVNGANYASAKAGIVGLCNALALEGQRHGILSNAILPVGMTRLGGAPDDVDDSVDAHTRRSELRRSAARSQPEWVAPLVAYLASSDCHTTHRYYSAANGRFARVFIGVANGWWATGDLPPSVDNVSANMASIEDLSHFDLPESVFEELSLINARFGS